MLIEFTVGNFRSIAEKATLSMIAAPIKSGPHAAHLDKENLIYINEKLSLLKTAAIYGANASGKSNLLSGLKAMGAFMRGSVNAQSQSIYPYEPFLLMEGYDDEPAHFEIVFLLNDMQHRYGFEVSKERVEREWLYFAPKSREALLFERTGSLVKIGNAFKGASRLENLMSEKALFLTVARDFNAPQAKSVFDWMYRFPFMSGLSETGGDYTVQCMDQDRNYSEIVEFIRALDTGISDISLSLSSETAEVENGYPKMLREHNGAMIYNESFSPKSKDFTRFVIETEHAIFSRKGEITNKRVLFNMAKHESEGTRKLFAMSGMIVNVLKNGHLLTIDELDAKLHPILTKKLVEMFHSEETNPKRAQLIFATHDVNLLSNKLFRRDQIWFAEKNRAGATSLFSLAEFKVRNDSSYEQSYIEGRYGAIPFPGGFEIQTSNNELDHVG